MQYSFGPRERIQFESVDVLSDTELVMALLGSGTARRGVASVSRSVVRKLLKYQPISFDGLMSIEGVGPAAAGRLMAAFSIAARFRHHIPLAQQWRLAPPEEGICFAQVSLHDSARSELASFVRTSSSLERLASECLRAAKELGAKHLYICSASHPNRFVEHLESTARATHQSVSVRLLQNEDV